MFDIITNVSNLFEELKINLRLILTNKSFMLLVISILTIFICLAYYIYNKLIYNEINKSHQLNKELIGNSKEFNENDILMVLFRTDWCPHCKSAQIEWNKFKTYINKENLINNNYKVIVTEVDCDQNPNIADKYDIEAYPTVKLFYKGTTYHYYAKVQKEQLIEFLESSID